MNCVVTRKTSDHGTAHWGSVSHHTADRCVMYYGWAWNPQGTLLADGGRQTWGNCG